MQNPVAVTGATGFVGRHVLRTLLAKGHNVRVLVRDATKVDFDSDQVEIVVGDLDDISALDKLVSGAASVIHIAGAIAALNRAGFFKVNHEGAQNIANAAGAAGVKRFIHVSSLTAREGHLSDYAASKEAGEEAVKAIVAKENLTIVRPPVVYGPGDRETLRLLRALTKKWAILPGPADQKLSLLYVKDLADLLVCLTGQSPMNGVTLEVDDGQAGGYNYADMVRLAGQVLGKEMRLILLPRGLVSLAAVFSQAGALLTGKPAVFTPAKVHELYHCDWTATGAKIKGWKPKVLFEEGFALTLSWYRQKQWLPGESTIVKSQKN